MLKQLGQIEKVLEVLRSVDPLMPIQLAHTFLAVALEPGITIADLGKRIGLAQSSCSRNVATLGTLNWRKEPGLGLVEAVSDPMEMRRKVVFLTPAGKALVDRLVDVLGSASASESTSYPSATEWLKKRMER